MELADGNRFAFLEQEFDLPGPVKSTSSLGSGHIHDTYLITCEDVRQSRFVLQKFNHQVFKHPREVAANILLVYQHFRQSKKNTTLQPLQLITTSSGALLYESSKGEFWRVLNYIEESDSFDKVNHPDQALGAAKAFGSFIEIMQGLDPQKLHTTIPDFHNLGRRFEQLNHAILEDKVNRVNKYGTEVEFALNRAPMVMHCTNLAEKDEIPLRVTHNDTKINNVLFKKGTTEAICVIDLDTVMPGLLLYDFGDMARTFCNSMLEEESAHMVSFRLEIFEALCKGFFENIDITFSQAEIDSLKAGPWWMTFIMGIRFFTDLLAGDVYYKINYPQQNLDRARNQFRLLADIEAKQTEINSIIALYS